VHEPLRNSQTKSSLVFLAGNIDVVISNNFCQQHGFR
jgi:hypothetical protein